MIECLRGYIGLTHCSGGAYETPESGMFINSLPGITLESIDKIADSEQTTYLGVWADVQETASARFRLLFINELNKCFKLNKECDYNVMVCENLEILTIAWSYLLANQLMIERIYSPRLNRYTTIGLEEARELKDHYQVEFENALKLAVTLVDISGCELCCSGNPTTVLYMP